MNARLLRSSIVLACCVAIPLSLRAEEFYPRVKTIMMRARATQLAPEVPVRIHWTWGGSGLGGNPVSGEFTLEQVMAPSMGIKLGSEAADSLVLDEDTGPKDRFIVQGDTYNYQYLKRGTWSPWVPLSTFKHSKGRLSVTFKLESMKQVGALRNCELEFELSHDGKSLKRFTVAGPSGPIFGVIIPFMLLDKDGGPTPEFVAQVGSLGDYTRRKVEALASEPWTKLPEPRLYAILSDCSGYGSRTADPQTMLNEYEVMRLMGMNGTRGSTILVTDMIRNGTGIGPTFSRAKIGGTSGYPIPMVQVADGRPPTVRPGDGCPFHPDNLKGIPGRVQAAVAQQLENPLPVEEVWALTDDEIGAVFGGTPEGRSHPGVCPHCREAFRQLVKKEGRTLEDFGATDWADIRSTHGYWGRSYWDIRGEREAAVKAAESAMKGDLQKQAEPDPAAFAVSENEAKELADFEQDLRGKPRTTAVSKPAASETRKKGGRSKGAATQPTVDDANTEAEEDDNKADPFDEPPADTAETLLAARNSMETLIWNRTAGQTASKEPSPRVSPAGWSLLQYYSARFANEASAGLFEPLQKAFAAANDVKRAAIAAGKLDSPEAKRPWIYSYALRGNTFLMGGSTLDFFDFYRYADNAFMYETSNRDRRVWQWDSYLCDVGRSLTRFMGKQFGVYVKPHRGAPVQRALTAVARGAHMIYWYTYGPEWQKGDSFGGNTNLLKKIGWVDRLIAGAEHVTYDSGWAVPPQVAIVRPFTSCLSGSASWENGKWVYVALQHAHIPVDALDEGLLMTEDISRYKVIVISGGHIRRDVALRLRQWVEAGGTLYTCGGGMARDESNQPLEVLWPVFGVTARSPLREWGSVPRYGATSLGSIKPIEAPPSDALITAQAPFQGTLTPAVGRELLSPAPGAEVMATFGGGQAAIIRNRYGKGTAWLVGFYAGLEYANDVMHSQPYDEAKRAFVAAPVRAAGVQAVADASVPLVESVLLKNPKTGKQAAILINWQFHVDQPMTVTFRGAGNVSSARSLALGQTFPLKKNNGALIAELPRMDEGDILLLE
jgi:hypothetical protein